MEFCEGDTLDSFLTHHKSNNNGKCQNSFNDRNCDLSDYLNDSEFEDDPACNIHDERVFKKIMR